jgi:nicotinamide riboside transporter PnuC
MERISERLISLANPRAVVLAIALYLASLVALSLSDRQIQAQAPGVEKPDLVFGYDYDVIMSLFNAMGEAGRRAYATNLVVDSIMPVMFAAATVLVVARAAPRWVLWLGLPPVIFMVLDLIEKAAFGAMLAQFPDVTPGLVAFTSPITMIKLAAFVVALPTLILGALFLIFRWARGNFFTRQVL